MVKVRNLVMYFLNSRDHSTFRIFEKQLEILSVHVFIPNTLKASIMKKLLILHIMILLFCFRNYSQDKVSASMGIGIPELTNVGFQYQYSQVKFGMSVGTAFAGFYALSGDVFYHFRNQARINDVSPWYLRGHVSYWPFGKFLFIDLGEVVLVGFRAGREIEFTESIGLRLDAGVIPFTFLSGNKVPFSFLPGLSISLYYRLGDLFDVKR